MNLPTNPSTAFPDFLPGPGEPFAPIAAVLTRVSTHGQAEEGVSLEVQEQRGRAAATRMGMPCYKVYEDAGVSGDLYNRPALQQALRDAEAGRINVLIVTDESRLSWNPEHSPRIQRQLAMAGCRLFFLSLNAFVDVDDYRQQFSLGVMTWAARFSRLHNAAESQKAQRKLASEGKQPCHFRPYGYWIVHRDDIIAGRFPADMHNRYVVVPEEAEIVQSIFHRYLNGESLNSIAKDLNLKEIPPLRSKRGWRSTTLRNLLKNPVYKGTGRYGLTKTFRDESRIGQISKHTGKPYTSHKVRVMAPESNIITIPVSALVLPQAWEEVQPRLAENHKKFSGRNDRRYLLSGLIVCPECKEVMRVRGERKRNGQTDPAIHTCRYGTPNGSLRYGKPRCHRTNYQMHTSEHLVAKAIEAVVTRPELVAEAVTAYSRRLTRAMANGGDKDAEIKRCQEKIVQLEEKRDLLISGSSGADEFWRDAFRKISQEWTQIKTRLADLMSADTEPAPEESILPVLPTLSGPAIAEFLQKHLRNAYEVLRDESLPLMERHTILRALVERIIPTEAPATKFDANGLAVRDAGSPRSPIAITVEFRPAVYALAPGMPSLAARMGVTMHTVPMFCTVTLGGDVQFGFSDVVSWLQEHAPVATPPSLAGTESEAADAR